MEKNANGFKTLQVHYQVGATASSYGLNLGGYRSLIRAMLTLFKRATTGSIQTTRNVAIFIRSGWLKVALAIQLSTLKISDM